MAFRLRKAPRRKGGSSEAEEASEKSSVRKFIENYWIERAIFVLGCLLLFVGEWYVHEYVQEAKETLEYFDQNALMVQGLDTSYKQRMSAYNRSLTEEPQNPDLLRNDAFEFYSETIQLLSNLRAVAEHGGKGDVLSVLKEKEARRNAARRDLIARDTEALIRKVNEAQKEMGEHHNQLQRKFVFKRFAAIDSEAKWTRRERLLRLTGTVLIAAAFVFREIHAYRKRRTEEEPSS